MRLIVLVLLISYGTSYYLKHPNSMKKTIDYSKSGNNWPGVCKSGVKQSPISLDKFDKIEKDILKLQYGKTTGTLEWNGSFYKMDFKDENSKAIFEDMKKKPSVKIEYILKRLIFRTPPEHTVEGKANHLEMQFVHETKDKSQANNILIISVFGKITKNAKLVEDWFKNIEEDFKSKSSVEGIDKALLGLKDYLHYEGSQTIPNCVENVNWIIFKKPMLIDEHKINFFKRNFCDSDFPTGNARHIQSSNGRDIIQYTLSEK